MVSTRPTEVNFYIDDELGPEEAAELEAWLETDSREQRLCRTLKRQKECLTQVIEALNGGCSGSGQTAQLQARLVDALWRRESGA